MADAHTEVKEAALEAVNALIGDMTVSQQQTLDDLEELEDLIGSQIQALRQELGQ